jgi:hypothetical protein
LCFITSFEKSLNHCRTKKFVIIIYPTIYIPAIVTIPRKIESPKPRRTLRPYSFSPKRYAIDAFTVLFDMTAMRMVVAAMRAGIDPSFAHSDIVKFTASTSANQEISPRK